jgi:ABC-type antimicrobial peptide transport system permease subunit
MAVLIRLRAELRSSWRSWAGYVVLVGLVGALVIAAAAGARRTETAVSRGAKVFNLTDAGMPIGSEFGFADLKQEDVERLPEVAELYRSDFYYLFLGRTEKGRKLSGNDVSLRASPDPRYGDSVDGSKIVEGRMLDPDRVDEVVPDELTARAVGLEVGDTFTVRLGAASQLALLTRDGGNNPPRLTGPRVRFRVVGISASFEPPSADAGAAIQLSTAFHRAYGKRLAGSTVFFISLKRGKADITSFKQGVDRLAKGRPTSFFTNGDFVDNLHRSTHIQAVALWVLAALGALVALLLVSQALSRQTLLESVEYPTLRALGMSRGQLLALALARAGAIGALLAVGGAIALSPLTPVGELARKGEPNPGVSADVMIVALGALAIVLLVLAVTAFPAWRAASTEPPRLGGTDLGRRNRASSVADMVARAGLTPAAVAGVRMALEPGRGRTAVPVRTAIAGVVLSVAMIAAALTFAASLDRLTTTPRLYGQTWDVQIGAGYGDDRAQAAFPILEHGTIGAFSAGTLDEVLIDGTRVGVLAMDSERGSIAPSVIEGRAPSAPDEVMLATKTLDDVGADIGDIVTIRVGSRSSQTRVVARGVMPDFTTSVRLGRGAFMTFSGFKRLVPRAPRNTFLARFAAGADKKASRARLDKAGDANFGVRPTDLANFSRVDSMPFVIGGVLGMAALATLVHTLVSSIRRRRRELAILKTLGFMRGQVSRAVAWQATTIILIALLIGIPLGIAAGRWAWTIFSDELGVVPETVVPLAPTLLLVPGALIAANLIAALPARIAGRTRPALVLRAE